MNGWKVAIVIANAIATVSLAGCGVETAGTAAVGAAAQARAADEAKRIEEEVRLKLEASQKEVQERLRAVEDPSRPNAQGNSGPPQ